MPDKSLIDFIVSQKRIGARIEKIRSDLMTGEWTDVDIDAALAYIEQQEKKRTARGKAFKKFFLILLGIILILGGTYITLTLMGKKVPLIPEQKLAPITFPDFTEPAPQEVIETSVPVVPDDITSVRAQFEKDFKDVVYIRAIHSGVDMIVSGLIKNEFGSTSPKDFYYSKVQGNWKWDEQKTEARYTASSTPVGLPPRVRVAEIRVTPLPPKVNDANTKILISLTNTSDLPTVGSTMFTIEYDERPAATTTYTKVINPGETAVVTFVPYPAGKKYTDKKGKHTIVVTLPDDEPTTKEFDLY